MSQQKREELAKELYDKSLDTLESGPNRALDLLRATGTNKVIRAQYQLVGYDPEVHEQGWRLLQATGGYGAPDTAVKAMDPVVAAAVVEVDPWDEKIVEIARLSVTPRHRVQGAKITERVKPAKGMEGVSNVRTILPILDGFENSLDPDDRAALQIFAKRGITPELRKHLAERVKIATSAPEVQLDLAALDAADEAYVRALGELWDWYTEWAGIGHMIIKRRDQLLQLGLAHRKTTTKGTNEVVVDPFDPNGPMD